MIRSLATSPLATERVSNPCATHRYSSRPQQPFRARYSATACQIITNHTELFVWKETYFWATWINTLQLSQMFTPTERQLPSFSSSSLDKVLIVVILTETFFCCLSIHLFIYPYLSVLLSLVVLKDELLAFRLTFKMKSIN